MVATDGETRKGHDKQNVSHVIFGKNVMSAQMLEVLSIIGSRNGAPYRKGCVVNGQMTKACNK